MAEEVDPAEAAPAGCDSDFSDTLATGADVADVACNVVTPIDPRCAVTEDSPPQKKCGLSTGLGL
eukprot:3974533-Pyramimonas_sp.AAC.1